MSEGKCTQQRLGEKWTHLYRFGERVVRDLFRRKTLSNIVHVWTNVLDHFERLSDLVKQLVFTNLVSWTIFTLKSGVCVRRPCYEILDDIGKDKYETKFLIASQLINDTSIWLARGNVFSLL